MSNTRWRQIKTAPKDGTLVMLYGVGYIKTGYYDDSPQIGIYPNWRWGLTCEPTHWMPLPPTPRENTGDAKWAVTKRADVPRWA